MESDTTYYIYIHMHVHEYAKIYSVFLVNIFSLKVTKNKPITIVIPIKFT